MYKILVPLDGSDHSLKALHIACDLAHKYRARLILLHIIDPNKKAAELLALPIHGKFPPALSAALHKAGSNNLFPLDPELLEQTGHSILKIAAARIKRLDLDYQILPLATGNPADNILTAHRMVAASTIVMGTRGLPPDRHKPDDSISRTVFAKADCTCISVK